MGKATTWMGPYRLLGRLGVGGMAEAFEAARPWTERTEQRVCVKRMLPAFANDADYVALFRREAELASKLVHPNVVQVLDVHGGPEPYLVLELVDGLDLRGLLASAPRARLSAVVTGYLVAELAQALAYAHEPGEGRPGLVHRDVSPSNVLLSRGGDVKLADFGLAKAASGGVATQSGVLRGKIPYMAPELMRHATVDGRADLFSLGVIAFECLAGARPFDGAHEVETMTRILGGQRRMLAELAPECPAELAALIEDLLAVDPDARPADAVELLERLDAVPGLANGRFELADLVELRLGGVASRAHVLALSPSRAPVAELHGASEPAANPASAEVYDASEPATKPARVRRPATLELAPTEPAAPFVAPPRRPAPALAALLMGGAMTAGVGLAVLRHEARGASPAGTRAESSSLSATASRDANATTGLRLTPGGAPHGSEANLAQSASSRGPQPSPRGGAGATTVQLPHAEALAEPARATALSAAASAAEPPPTAAPAAVDVPSASAPTPDAPPPTVANAAPAAALESAAPAEPAEPATLRVVAHPWGLVWVDGRQLGRAPQTIRLAAGTHRVAVGQDGPAVERRVGLESGDHRTVEIDLGE